MDYWSIWSKVITDVDKYKQKKKKNSKNSTLVNNSILTAGKKYPFYLYIILEGWQINIKKAELFQLSNYFFISYTIIQLISDHS